MNPFEAIGFQKCVMAAFDNREFVKNWERLRRKELKSKKVMNQFISDVRNLIWERLTIKVRKEICLK